jgi:hypothetical protein
MSSTCPDALRALATATTDLTIKNYQWVWRTYGNLRGSLFNGANPIGSEQTYFDMSGSAPSLSDKTITQLSEIYTGYTNGTNDVFYSSIRILHEARLQPYIDLLSTYTAFVANKSIKDVDAEDTNTTVNALDATFPTITDANRAKSNLKPENLYLPYNDENAALVSTIQGTYGNDLFVVDEPITTNSPIYLEKALSTIKSELSDYIEEYNTIYGNTAPSFRPPSATEVIGIPPPNTSTNVQDLIAVMNEYMNKSALLVRGGKQKNAENVIGAYKLLYGTYVSYLTPDDKDVIGADGLSYKHLYDEAPDVSTLTEVEANAMYNRYKTAVGAEPTSSTGGTGLNNVIISRLRTLCTGAVSEYKQIFRDFQPLLEYSADSPYPDTLNDSLTNAYNTAYITNQISKTALVSILTYYSYHTDYTKEPISSRPNLQLMTNFLKGQLISRLNDISGSLVGNADILGIPLQGNQVLDTQISTLSATLIADTSAITTKLATKVDVGNVDTSQTNSLYKLAQKYLASEGLKDLLESEIDRLTELNAKRIPAKSHLELFYDDCYIPLKARLDHENYTLPTITDYILEGSLSKTTRDLNSDMTDTFYGLGLEELQNLTDKYDFTIENIKSQIKSAIKSDLLVYKELYNTYTVFATTYSTTFSEQSANLASSSVVVLEMVNQPSPVWKIDPKTKRIVEESIDFLEFDGIVSAPASAPAPAPTTSTSQSQITAFVSYMKDIWTTHFVKNGSQSSYMFTLIDAIKTQFSTFLVRFDAISDAVSEKSYTIKFQEGERTFYVSLRYEQYETDSGRLTSIPTSDLVDDSAIELYKKCIKYNDIFMDPTIETLNNTINLAKGLIPRYTTLVPMFCVDDDRRRAIASLKEFWDKYTQLRTYSIPFSSIPTGIVNLLTYFTQGELNDKFNGQTESFYEELQRDYRNPDSFTEPIPNAVYFADLKQATTAAVTSIVNSFLSGILEKRRILQNKENAWELDIADIFYTPTPEPGVYGEPQLSFTAICEGIYQVPSRYPRLVEAYQSSNTLWELAKYKKCIPIDVRNRPSKNVLRSRFAR